MELGDHAHKHYWLPILRSSVYGSYLEVHYPAGALAGFGGAVGVSNLKEARIGTNLVWTPLEGFDIGAEFMRSSIRRGRLASPRMRFSPQPACRPSSQPLANTRPACESSARSRASRRPNDLKPTYKVTRFPELAEQIWATCYHRQHVGKHLLGLPLSRRCSRNADHDRRFTNIRLGGSLAPMDNEFLCPMQHRVFFSPHMAAFAKSNATSDPKYCSQRIICRILVARDSPNIVGRDNSQKAQDFCSQSRKWLAIKLPAFGRTNRAFDI
jgi:hypothetical protein